MTEKPEHRDLPNPKTDVEAVNAFIKEGWTQPPKKGTAHGDKASEKVDGFTSKEELLQQLRVDAKTKQTREAEIDSERELRLDLDRRSGKHPQDREHEQQGEGGRDAWAKSLLTEKANVEKYSPQQLEMISALYNSAGDPVKMQNLINKFTDQNEFRKLEDGIHLEGERRNGRFSVSFSERRNAQDKMAGLIYVSDRQTKTDSNYEGPGFTTLSDAP
jgi:hypothetical protein